MDSLLNHPWPLGFLTAHPLFLGLSLTGVEILHPTLRKSPNDGRPSSCGCVRFHVGTAQSDLDLDRAARAYRGLPVFIVLPFAADQEVIDDKIGDLVT
jgi:hypothetical protein